MTRRILVICGSRALDASPRPRRWAKREIAAALARFAPDVVVHGFARGPDTWADELAACLELPRVHFALSVDRPWCFDARGVGRLAKGAERYTYDGAPKVKPLARNEAMMRWAADRSTEGHIVMVLALRAPWATTKGTAHALTCARDFELAVTAPDLPPDAWPDESDAHEGQHGA